ncbi:MAG TPA: flagellar biosynthetic protein FliO [Fusibacter sp.]|jgi:flagellar biogenesis protein FliO|nr:flagellar biosynthetic protein FliO [Fusibacter sp.]
MGIFTYSITRLAGYDNSSDTLFTIKYIIVATVFLFLLWGLSKYLTKRHFVGLREKNIKVIERVAISSDKFLYLVELDQIHYLIGSDKSGMTVIDKREHLNIEISKQIEPQTDAFFEQLKTSILKRESKKNSKDKSDE